MEKQQSIEEGELKRQKLIFARRNRFHAIQINNALWLIYCDDTGDDPRNDKSGTDGFTYDIWKDVVEPTKSELEGKFAKDNYLTFVGTRRQSPEDNSLLLNVPMTFNQQQKKAFPRLYYICYNPALLGKPGNLPIKKILDACSNVRHCCSPLCNIIYLLIVYRVILSS